MLDFDREFGKVYNSDFIHNSAEVVFWPNPVNDIMNLKTNEAIPCCANIYNLLGQEIKSA